MANHEVEETLSRAAAEPVSRRDLVALLGAFAGASALGACADTGQAAEPLPLGQSSQNLLTIAGGANVTDYPSLEAGVSANPAGSPITLIIDKPICVVSPSGSLTVPAHVTLRFQDGGQLVVPQGQTVVLAGPIEAPPNPFQPLFRVGGLPAAGPCDPEATGTAKGGTVVPNHSGTKYYANWWSDDLGRNSELISPNHVSAAVSDIGQQWNNMMAGVEKSSAAVARHFAVAGNRSLQTMLDARDFQSFQQLDFSAARLRVDMPSGGIAVNFTNSVGLYVRGLNLWVNADLATNPDVGVLVARSPTGASESVIVFDHLVVAGRFQIACLYNVASRGNVFVGGRLDNSTTSPVGGRYTAFFGAFVEPEFPLPSSGSLPYQEDDYSGVPPQPGMTARDQVVLATKCAGSALTVATICVQAFNEVSFVSPYCNSNPRSKQNENDVVPPAKPHVFIDTSKDTVQDIAIEDIYGHGGPAIGLQLAGANRLWNFTFSTRNFAATEKAVENGVTFVNGAKFRVGGTFFECLDGTWLRHADIELRARPVKLKLGKGFTGRIAIDALVDAQMNSMLVPGQPMTMFDAEIATLSHDTDSPRNRHQIPLHVIGRGSVPSPEQGEAILWMDSGTGNFMATVAREGETRVFTLAQFASLTAC
jgi:hypothetical protein